MSITDVVYYSSVTFYDATISESSSSVKIAPQRALDRIDQGGSQRRLRSGFTRDHENCPRGDSR
jgi:hypothetical protein